LYISVQINNYIKGDYFYYVKKLKSKSIHFRNNTLNLIFLDTHFSFI